jgi:hypothetical protein
MNADKNSWTDKTEAYRPATIYWTCNLIPVFAVAYAPARDMIDEKQLTFHCKMGGSSSEATKSVSVFSLTG